MPESVQGKPEQWNQRPYGGTLGSGIYPSNFDVRYTAQKTQPWTEF